jgi:hypothetical protein
MRDLQVGEWMSVMSGGRLKTHGHHSSLRVVLLLTALALFLFLLFLLAVFDFAATLGVLEANGIIHLLIELL